MLAATRRFVLVLIACVAAGAIVTPQGSYAQQPAPAPDAAAQQRAALIAQLQNGPAADAGVANAEKQLGAVQERLIAMQKSLTDTNARLLTVQRLMTQNQQTLVNDQANLSTMLRDLYERSGQHGLTTALLTSDNFNQAFDRYRNEQHASGEMVSLVDEVASARQALVAEQASLQTDIAKSQALEAQLSAQSDRLTAMVAARNAALVHAARPTQAVVAQIDTHDNRVAAALVAPTAPTAQGPCGNHFALGQCTWYVASRRCVPWLGNAFAWWPNAQAAGFAEGHAPQPGAVVVWMPGGGGAGGVGHVGYVESVGPAGDVPAGSFKLSEMNWGAWDRVDYRVLPNNAPGIAGFIYGHA